MPFLTTTDCDVRSFYANRTLSETLRKPCGTDPTLLLLGQWSVSPANTLSTTVIVHQNPHGILDAAVV